MGRLVRHRMFTAFLASTHNMPVALSPVMKTNAPDVAKNQQGLSFDVKCFRKMYPVVHALVTLSSLLNPWLRSTALGSYELATFYRMVTAAL